jgi:hypothetical protein
MPPFQSKALVFRVCVNLSYILSKPLKNMKLYCACAFLKCVCVYVYVQRYLSDAACVDATYRALLARAVMTPQR